MVKIWQADNHVDDAVAGPEPFVGLLEPGGQNTVFDHPVEYAVGADDGGVHGPGKNERAHDDHEALEDKPQRVRADHVHRQAADEVGKIVLTHPIGNDHDREERNQRSEKQAVQEDHQPGLLQVLEFGMFDLAVDLGQRLLAAHGEHRMAEADQQHDQRNARRPGPQQPAQRLAIMVHVNHSRQRR